MLRQRRSFEFHASGVWSIWDVFTYLCESPWERCQIRIRSLKTDVESESDRCRWIFIYPQPTLHFFGPWQEAAVQGERNPHEEKRKPTLSQDSNQETSGRRPALTTTSTVRSNTDVCAERQKTLGDVSPVSIFSQMWVADALVTAEECLQDSGKESPTVKYAGGRSLKDHQVLF